MLMENKCRSATIYERTGTPRREELERGEVPRNWRDAMLDGTMPGITLESMLSQGSEDVLAHDYHEQALSMQELLVQREGSDAFLDPKNALRVVRRMKWAFAADVLARATVRHNDSAHTPLHEVGSEIFILHRLALEAMVKGTIPISAPSTRRP